MIERTWRDSPADRWPVSTVASFEDFLLEGLELLISTRGDEHWGLGAESMYAILAYGRGGTMNMELYI